MIRIIQVLLLLAVLLFNSCQRNYTGNRSVSTTLRIAFYNVENLFDVIDDPVTNDDEFTPDGKKKWTEERFSVKLDRIVEVFDSLDYPQVIGLAEIENLWVLEKLVQHPGMQPYNYKIVHQNSSDKRGIDVAMIYQEGIVSIVESNFIRPDFPQDKTENYTSRDILIAKGTVGRSNEVTFFVNHWPSRRDGPVISGARRARVAALLKEYVEKQSRQEDDPNLIFMGDFNDEPFDPSVDSVMGVIPLEEEWRCCLIYNAFNNKPGDKQGSYNYRGNWVQMDQIWFSSSLDKPRANLKFAGSGVCKGEWLMYKDDRFGWTPNRTYGGPNYYGGYSDHLAVYADFILKN